MKRLIALLALTSCIAALAEESKSADTFLAFRPAEVSRFGLRQAQALADAQRVSAYGICGMSIFKGKRGSLWIFETKVGYGGVPKPDIAVVEPAEHVVSPETPNQPPEPAGSARGSS